MSDDVTVTATDVYFSNGFVDPQFKHFLFNVDGDLTEQQSGCVLSAGCEEYEPAFTDCNR